MTQRYFSFGGGVQSMAVMVLAAQGKVRYDQFLFANVGEDSENPATLVYLENYAKPFAEDYDIDLVELHHLRKGTPETLLGRIQRSERSLPLPVRMSNGAPGRRSCTTDFKIRVIARYQKQGGQASATPQCAVWESARTNGSGRARTAGLHGRCLSIRFSTCA